MKMRGIILFEFEGSLKEVMGVTQKMEYIKDMLIKEHPDSIQNVSFDMKERRDSKSIISAENVKLQIKK